jgi:hypothetical protein
MALCYTGLDYNAELYVCIATDVCGWQLAGMAFYQGIPLEITYTVSVARLSQAQCEGCGR